jgi:hypothetical protein
METIAPNMIPTRGKGKISHLLSFPIGAKQISDALRTSPQFSNLELYFRPEFFNSVRDSSQYLILMIVYSGIRDAPKTNIGVSLRTEWRIGVHPVPRIFRKRIQQYILESALPQISFWLEKRSDLAQEGGDMIRFYYDEKKEEFSMEQENTLQPLREAKGRR